LNTEDTVVYFRRKKQQLFICHQCFGQMRTFGYKLVLKFKDKLSNTQVNNLFLLFQDLTTTTSNSKN